MRFIGHAAVGVVACLLGLALGYVIWGTQAARLSADIRSGRLDCEARVGAMEQRARRAEDDLRQETKLRKLFEEQLEEVSPQK